MGKIVLTVILVLLLIAQATTARAQSIAGHSAMLQTSNNGANLSLALETEYRVKKMAIQKVMEKYNSPMAEAEDAFIKACIDYDLNCYLLPSIAILESTFGNHIYPGSHNPFGWGGGYIMFDSWAVGIDTVGRGLRNNYINKGASTMEEVASIYAASPTWAPRVRNIQKMFEAEEEKIRLYLNHDAVQL
jgi:hypothetical protein